MLEKRYVWAQISLCLQPVVNVKQVANSRIKNSPETYERMCLSRHHNAAARQQWNMTTLSQSSCWHDKSFFFARYAKANIKNEIREWQSKGKNHATGQRLTGCFNINSNFRILAIVATIRKRWQRLFPHFIVIYFRCLRCFLVFDFRPFL